MVEESKEVDRACMPTIRIDESTSGVDVGPFGFPLEDPFADNTLEENELIQFSQVE